MLQEHSYDSWIPDKTKIYRVETAEVYPGRNPLEIARVPGPLVDTMAARFPEITSITKGFLDTTEGEIDNHIFQVKIFAVDPNFLDVIQLPLIETSNTSPLNDISSLIISQKMAEKHFGKQKVIGETITLDVNGGRDYTVTGVFKTLPRNTHLSFDLLIPHDSYFDFSKSGNWDFIPEQWGGAYYHAYFKLDDVKKARLIQSRLPDLIDEYLPDNLAELISVKPRDFFQFKIRPIKDIHLKGYTAATMKEGGDKTALNVFIIAASIVLLIASLNYAIIIAAEIIRNKKELAVHKAMGATPKVLISGLVLKNSTLLITALIISVFVLQAFLFVESTFYGDKLIINSIFDTAIPLLLLASSMSFIGALGLVFPILYIWRLAPRWALKSSRGGSGQESTSHKFLLFIQFFASFCIVACCYISVLQYNFTQSGKTGFDAAPLVVIKEPSNSIKGLSRFSDSLKRLDGVLGTSQSSAVPFIESLESEANISVDVPSSEKPIPLGAYRTDLDFFETYDIKPLHGRVFSANRESDYSVEDKSTDRTTISAVINLSAAKRLGYFDPEKAIGKTLRSGKTEYFIIGVIEDIRFRTVRFGSREDIFYASKSPGDWTTIKLRQSDDADTLEQLERAWKAEHPRRTPKYIRLEDAIKSTYSDIKLQGGLMVLFSIVTLLLSIMGLLAVTIYSAEIRRKENAIRKVIGATQSSSLYLATSRLITPVFLSITVGIPTSYWLGKKWLHSFAEQVSLNFTPFIVSALIVLLLSFPIVAIFTVFDWRRRPSKLLR